MDAQQAAARIREALEMGPTDGPWIFYADTPSTDPNWHIVTTKSRLRILANVHIEPGNAMDAANAQWIAACSPDALRALLAERDEQRGVIAELLDQMHHFANADQRLWDESQRDPESFKSWVRSRAAHLLAKFTDRAALAALTNKD